MQGQAAGIDSCLGDQAVTTERMMDLAERLAEGERDAAIDTSISIVDESNLTEPHLKPLYGSLQ